MRTPTTVTMGPYGLSAAGTGTAWPTLAQRRQHGAPGPEMRWREPSPGAMRGVIPKAGTHHGDYAMDIDHGSEARVWRAP